MRWNDPKTAVWAIIFLIGLIGWLLLLPREAERAWRGFLVAFLYVTPLAGGLVAWSGIAVSSRGKWPGEMERYALSATAFAFPSLIALVLLGIFSRRWAPWALVRPHQGLWLSPPFVFGRDLVCLAIFWILAVAYRRHRERGEGNISAPWLVFIYCIVFSQLGFDLIMGLDPKWYSSLFGGYVFISGFYVAMACWTLLCTVRPGVDPERMRDCGNLLLAFCLLTTYMLFCQLLPIWYENLPKEIRYVVPRLNFNPWFAVSSLLLVWVYLGPLALLLWARGKKKRGYLGFVAAYVLTGMWVERLWLVNGGLTERIPLGIPEFAPLLLLAGLLGAGMTLTARRLPAVMPDNKEGP